MKNIYILPTTESSRLKDENLYSSPSYILSREPLHWRYAVHMYITSEDEDIYENDYIITQEGKLVQVSYLLSSDIYKSSKVIMTTSQKLIEDGVQEIDDTFLEWFIENPTCEFVKIESWETKGEWNLDYIIIIPQEESEEETLEEVAANLADPNICKTDNWIAGAKWQAERMYSEEEVVGLLNFVSKEYNISNGIGWFHTHESNEDISSKEVLDKFKKK